MDELFSPAESAEKILERFRIPFPLQIHIGLTRMQKIMDALGNPENLYPTIHVAGTNGKGSVTSMLASVFRALGYKTGVFTSPHLQRFTERTRIDYADKREEFNENDFKNILVNKILPIVKGLNVKEGQPTEFELLTAATFTYFKEQNVDIAIIETGLGGRLDATNVLKLPLASIITNIGLDHSERLGNSIEKIAYEKGCIAKRDSIMITSAEGESLDVIKKTSLNLEVKGFHSVDADYLELIESNRYGIKVICNKGKFKNEEFRIPLAGKHQIYNLGTVIRTLDELFPVIETKIKGSNLLNTIKQGLKNTYLNGRMELKETSHGLYLLDGAHNEDGAKVLSEFLKEEFSDYNVIILAAVSGDKNYKKMLDYLMQNSNNFIFTQAAVSKALNPSILAEYARLHAGKIQLISDYRDAFKEALSILKEHNEKSSKNILCICGSLYLVGEIRSLIDIQ